MTRRAVLLAAAVALAAVGCGGIDPDKFDQPVDVAGTVTLADGKPAKNVNLYLQPTGDGLPAELPVAADGSFGGKVIPGKYVYYITAKSEAALKGVPESYRTGSMDRQVTVKAGERLAIRLQ